MSCKKYTLTQTLLYTETRIIESIFIIILTTDVTDSCSKLSDHRYRGDPRTSNTAPCNGAASHGAPIGGIRVFADHAHGNKCKQNAPTIFARNVAFHTHLSSSSDHSTPDESRLF